MRTAIYCSKKVGLRMRIRSGGHDFEGSSYVSNATFFVMDMFNYRYVKVNNKERTAWVGAGATIGETYYAINKTNSSLAFAAGYWPTIGVGGHVSGGGYGPLIRKHGLAADNVIDARIVDAKGRVLTRASMGEDVFWAIRGGTGASFCVILAYKVKLVAITPRVTAFRLYKTLETNATNLVHKWQFVAPKLPRDLLLSLQITSINSNQTGRKTIQASFVAVFQGGVDQLLSIMQNQFPELGLTRRDCIRLNWLDN
ncbi:berberine bridge enzyme-like 8 [Coffea eugenioides]|uniref:berberine bridge enzyme-like 8 n=1 Tax=Coffea eugenioides TaxID=49369 RepID=UPI000F609D6D|nr:berberine bridge enzyme-like 8 [Coffea eugenioides]